MKAVLSRLYEQWLPNSAFKRRFNKAQREAELELLPRFVAKDRQSIDVGANVGHYTMALSSLTSRVTAFEPNPRLARLLRKCAPGNVEVMQVALSDHNGTSELKIPLSGGREVSGMASLEQARTGDFHTVPVEIRILDEVAQGDVGFIKIDVEGHEGSVLSGAHGLIERCRPTVLVEVEERHRSGSVGQIFSYFSDKNYKGLFLNRGRLSGTEEFSLEEHQNAARLGEPGKQYVNNFFFVPR